MADLKAATSPDILRTVLGSCVAVCLYDPETRIGGISHIMLPSNNSLRRNEEKYADTAIPLLLNKICSMGVKKKRITAKLAGGAKMLAVLDNGGNGGHIGERNIEMTRKILKDNDIAILAEDVGGDFARTLDFNLDNGSIRIKNRNKVLKTI